VLSRVEKVAICEKVFSCFEKVSLQDRKGERHGTFKETEVLEECGKYQIQK
jgi:hypothetical protein